MISSCFCSGEAQARLCDFFGFRRDENVDGVQVEFKEIPYFVVSRSRHAWNPEQGDINAINYFVAQKYVEAFGKFAESNNTKTLILPADLSSLAGTIGGVAELIKAVSQDTPAKPAPAKKA